MFYRRRWKLTKSLIRIDLTATFLSLMELIGILISRICRLREEEATRYEQEQQGGAGPRRARNAGRRAPFSCRNERASHSLACGLRDAFTFRRGTSYLPRGRNGKSLLSDRAR